MSWDVLLGEIITLNSNKPVNDSGRILKVEDHREKLEYPFGESEWLVPRIKLGRGESDMTSFPDFRKTEGRIVVLVDDALDSGGTRNLELYLKMRNKYRFGRYVSIKDPASGFFNGRRLV